MWTSAFASFRRLNTLVLHHAQHQAANVHIHWSYSVLSVLRSQTSQVSTTNSPEDVVPQSSWTNSDEEEPSNRETRAKASAPFGPGTRHLAQSALHHTHSSGQRAARDGLADGDTARARPGPAGAYPETPGAAAEAPPPARSASLAPYVLASPGLRRLVQLGVDTSGWERRPGIAQFVVRLDFERDMWPHVQWLHDVGVPGDRLGPFLTHNPLIFKEQLDDLQVRVNYLEAKKFSSEQIVSVVSRNPFWLMFSTKRIDRRLGFFMKLFCLKAIEVRQLAAKCPGIITSQLQHLKASRFTIKEEFGFTSNEMKQILLGKPKVWMLSRPALQERLHFLHNEMGLSHKLISEAPNVLTFRTWRVRQRHLMLNMLGRDQYDKTRPGFVSLDSLVATSDEVFCRDIAKVPVATYNEFLKTL